MKEYIVKDDGNVMMVGGKIIQELVRCKDCKWFVMPQYGERGFCKNHEIITQTVWFCADGRKNNA